MNLAQHTTWPPIAPINLSIPDLSKWEITEDQARTRERKDLIAETLEELKSVLTYPMTVAQIRELMPEAPPALKDWLTVWYYQGHVNRRRLKGQYLYTLGKGV